MMTLIATALISATFAGPTNLAAPSGVREAGRQDWSQARVVEVHHKPGHTGGRGRHLGWYKKNRGKHKGWYR